MNSTSISSSSSNSTQFITAVEIVIRIGIQFASAGMMVTAFCSSVFRRLASGVDWSPVETHLLQFAQLLSLARTRAQVKHVGSTA